MPNCTSTEIRFKTLFPLALSLSLLGACQQVGPADQGAEKAVLSESAELKLGPDDYAMFLRDMPDKAREQIAASDAAIVDQVLDYHSTSVLYQRALAQGVHQRPDVRAELHSAQLSIVVNAYMDQVLAELKEPEGLTDIARERYLQAEEKMYTVERRKVAHILIKDQSCACQKEAPADRVARIQKELAKGVSFEELVKKHSDDRSTANDGGLLRRWISKNGETERAFEEAVFKLQKVGDVSEAVSTMFGLHLVKLVEIDPVRKLTFEEAREVLEEEIRKSVVASALEQERGAAYPNPQSIDIEAIRKLITADLSEDNGFQPTGDR